MTYGKLDDVLRELQALDEVKPSQDFPLREEGPFLARFNRLSGEADDVLREAGIDANASLKNLMARIAEACDSTLDSLDSLMSNLLEVVKVLDVLDRLRTELRALRARAGEVSKE